MNNNSIWMYSICKWNKQAIPETVWTLTWSSIRAYNACASYRDSDLSVCGLHNSTKSFIWYFVYPFSWDFMKLPNLSFRDELSNLTMTLTLKTTHFKVLYILLHKRSQHAIKMNDPARRYACYVNTYYIGTVGAITCTIFSSTIPPGCDTSIKVSTHPYKYCAVII